MKSPIALTLAAFLSLTPPVFAADPLLTPQTVGPVTTPDRAAPVTTAGSKVPDGSLLPSLSPSPLTKTAPAQKTAAAQPQTVQAASTGDPAVSEDGYFTGVRNGAELSGTVKISINPDSGLQVKKVAYYLNGTQAGKEYASPYTFGGPSGYDTTRLADGQYTLSGAITTYSGDKGFSYTFTIKNSGTTTPPDTTPPDAGQPQPISPGGRTLGGLDYSAQNAGFVDVEKQGTLSFLADGNGKLYIVDRLNAASPKEIARLSFQTPLVDILADGSTLWAVERGASTPDGFRSQVWKINVSNPAAPTRVSFQGPLNAKALAVDTQNIYILHRDEYNVRTCDKNTLACEIPTGAAAYYNAGDFIHKNSRGTFTALKNGTYLYATGDFTPEVLAQPLPAPANHLAGSGNLLFASLQDGTVAIYDTAQITDGSSVPRVQTLHPQSTPVFSAYENGVLAVLENGGQIEVYDLNNLQSPVHVDSLTQSGAVSLKLENGKLHVVSATEYRILQIQSGTTTPPPPTTSGDMAGISNGQTVSGAVHFGPSSQILGQVRKVAYYLNGTQSGKTYTSPFTWGGSGGFDTRTLANGTYTISGYYTTATGDKAFDAVTFTVKN
ncbi:MAG TPA: Ig-like domain-containing protein [Verrucomicrobiae bacterium]|jgi:hypothetical protein|nr:Ig-like domain-containing protein [Verrucomicrobiae bacterium]